MLVKIAIPLAVGQLFSYSVPKQFEGRIEVGMRVDVLFNKRHVTGLIFSIEPDSATTPLLEIVEIIDDKPIVTPDHLSLWQWISTYYGCSLGEVMFAALPGALRLQSDMRLVLSPAWKSKALLFTDEEHDLIELLENRGDMTVGAIQNILPNAKRFPVLDSLIRREVISTINFLEEGQKVKPYKWLIMADTYLQDTDIAFKLCEQSKHQTEALLDYYSIYQKKGAVRYDHWANTIPNKSSTLNAFEKKGILRTELSVKSEYNKQSEANIILNDEQLLAYQDIIEVFNHDNKPVLLHGITGSGKTHLYFKLFGKYIQDQKQILYLVPEIALTIQLVSRAQQIFGDLIHVYNYKTSITDRLRIWDKILLGESIIIIGARSAIFLPFTNLGLTIVDEEHDASYKQSDVNPRYNARDVAIFISNFAKSHILLGTATPSVESYFNASSNKYHLIQLMQRYSGIQLPVIQLIDLKKYPFDKRSELLSKPLIDEIDRVLQNNKQVIIFLNRRGFHTLTFCQNCEWRNMCHQCDVSLVYHLRSGRLHCHQCGVHKAMPERCPSCGNELIFQKGYGTQRIEEELLELFPDRRIQRFDIDSVRGKKAYQRIIGAFGARKLDILIGTQMVTKGLDFDHVGLVGVLQGDQILRYPDFRSIEYTYQLMTQVAGRAGRKEDIGSVLIQSYETDHPVFQHIIRNDFQAFYRAEIAQRKEFHYPPFTKLIVIEIRHKKLDKLKSAGTIFNSASSERIRRIISGPAVPYVGRLRGYFRNSYLLKIKKVTELANVKNDLLIAKKSILNTKGLSGIRFIIDVDPR